MAEPVVGQVIDGRYELEAVIGKGGMGAVFRARHLITHGRVALKVLTDAVDAEARQRFLAEARAAATIGHPAIVAVSDASWTPEGQLYLVMELLAGKPLRIAMHGGLPGDQIRRIGLELLDALGAAHARGIIHRDLKPENIFVLAGSGTLKVLDFGIAKVMGAGSITASGYMLGTLEYMAPEQLVDAARIDGRADLWAVGVILYEMIAGVRPLGGATREAKYCALATDEPMPIGEVVSVSPDVAAFFAQALARDPAQRFQTAQQMAAALRSLSMVPQTASHAAQSGAGSTLGTSSGGPGSVTMGTGAGLQAGSTTGTGAAWSPPRPPPGSIPPPDVTGAQRPMMPSPAPIQPAPFPGHAQPTSSSGKTIVIAVGLVVVAGAIAFGVVMGTRSKTGATRADATSTPADAAIARTVDASDPPKRADIPVPADAAEQVASAGCEDHCKQLETCGLRLSSCLDDCKDPVNRQCLDHAKNSCEELAKCFWSRRYCQGVLVNSGSMTCLAAIKCLEDTSRFPNDIVCDSCVRELSPTAALLYAKTKVCRDNAITETNKAILEKREYPGNLASRCDQLQTECSEH